jgi:DNA polymerase III subunit gamma/tau
MVFYRKYRPQKIDDLDSTTVRETLASALSQKSVPHAFLFTGPKGLGKTSSARIVAKVVNCERKWEVGSKKPEKDVRSGKSKKSHLTLQNQASHITSPTSTIEPCNKCESCISITEGTNLDILEIDAASNRGIDEIRELKEKIRLSPVSSKKKVYIIDEVHMLTTEAFNALLKTLEEPPSHAMFILATTEAHKVPPTIISRCFHVGFARAGEEELMRSLERIAKGEKIDIEKKALRLIAGLSDGSFRDGAKILEEASALAGEKSISTDLIEKKYKLISFGKNIEDFILFIKNKDAGKSLNLIAGIAEQGADMKHFIERAVEILHKELLLKVADEKKGDLEMTIDEIRLLINLLSRAYSETKYAVMPQLPLELAVIEYSQGNTDQEIVLTAEVAQSKTSSIGDLRRQQGNIQKISAMYGTTKQNPVKSKEGADKKSDISLLQTSNGEITAEWLSLFWRSLISEMKSYNHTIAGVLRGCQIEKFDNNLLIIVTAYKFHKERLDETKTINEIARLAKVLTGREIKVEVQLKQ